MRVTCPKCGRAIPGGDIDLRGRAAVCRPCGEVVSFALPSDDGAPVKLYKPVDVRWTELPATGGVGYAIVVRQARWPGVLLAPFAVFWNGMVASFVLARHGPPPIFLGLHVAAGIYMAYSALVLLFNRTRVTLDRDRFRAIRGPIPQRGNVDQTTREIESFGVDEAAAKARFWTDPANWNRGALFEVTMHTRDARSCRTPLRFSDRSHAEYAAGRLAQMLEDVRTASDDATPYRGLRVEQGRDDGEGDTVESSDDSAQPARRA
jgi:hypothetical protein